jgi:hypothetical protein
MRSYLRILKYTIRSIKCAGRSDSGSLEAALLVLIHVASHILFHQANERCK